jgi:hypothetical protein
VRIFDGRKVIAHHLLLTHRCTSHDNLDHYLEILLRRPRGAPSC